MNTYKIQTNDGFIPIQADRVVYTEDDMVKFVQQVDGKDVTVAQTHKHTVFYQVEENLKEPPQ